MGALRERIIELLIQNGLLTREKLQECLAVKREKEARLSKLLIEKNFIQEQTLLDFIHANVSLPVVNTAQIKIVPETLKIISRDIATGYRLVPASKDDQVLTVVMSDPLAVLDLDGIKEFEGYTLKPAIAAELEVEKLIEHYYPKAPQVDLKSASATMEDILSGVTDLASRTQQELNVEEITQITEEVPVIKATNLILEKAIELKASDILVEPLEKAMRIRMRIDGALHQMETLPMSFHPFIVSRVKVISNLDISEHRMPQDGQFKIKYADKEVEFRVSVINSSSGEKVAIRILDKSLALLDIDKLGLEEEKLAKLKRASLLPYGMVLVCGPTGSGKTTTLYSILKYIHTPEKNIVTVEDPVEYQLKGINQVAVNPKTGLIFSRCLRSILRQDPDVIMIGEIRDFETVDIAIKAALTGHMVLSTLHTTTAPGSIIRLLDMGVQPFLINASVVAIIAQRLARRICPACRQKIPDQPYFAAKGCKECLNSGYSGRLLISEILYVTPKIKESIVSGRLEENKIKELARAEGMKTLREEGEALARAGLTTLEEVLRVTPADETKV